MILRHAIFILQITFGCNGCFPRKTKVLTESYIPAAIQTLHHYRTQLQEYLPYTYTAVCGFGEKDAVPAPPVLSTDVCVEESLHRINLFLVELEKEAVKQNLQDFQGFGRGVLAELEKASHLISSTQQLHFVLKKIQQEGVGKAAFKCQIVQFLYELEDVKSRFYKNLLNVKPLNYLC